MLKFKEASRKVLGAIKRTAAGVRGEESGAESDSTPTETAQPAGSSRHRSTTSHAAHGRPAGSATPRPGTGDTAALRTSEHLGALHSRSGNERDDGSAARAAPDSAAGSDVASRTPSGSGHGWGHEQRRVNERGSPSAAPSSADPRTARTSRQLSSDMTESSPSSTSAIARSQTLTAGGASAAGGAGGAGGASGAGGVSKPFSGVRRWAAGVGAIARKLDSPNRFSGASRSPASSPSTSDADTANPRYESLFRSFLAYNEHLQGLRAHMGAFVTSMESLCLSMDTLSEGVVPALSVHHDLRMDAGGYLNAVTSISNTLAQRFKKAVQASVLHPLDLLLRMQSELLRRSKERDAAVALYIKSKKALQKAQKRSVGRRGAMTEKERTKRANIVNNLSNSLAMYTTLTDVLSDEFAGVLSVREQVVAELFARMRSCQAYFFLGAGSAFAEAQPLGVTAATSVASPLHGKASPTPPSPAHKPLPKPGVTLDTCLLALNQVQDTPPLRWETLGREVRGRRRKLKRAVPLFDEFEAPAAKSGKPCRTAPKPRPSTRSVPWTHACLNPIRGPVPTSGSDVTATIPALQASVLAASATATAGGMAPFTSATRPDALPATPPSAPRTPPPVRAGLVLPPSSRASSAAAAVLMSRKHWIRRICAGLSVADLVSMSGVCTTWNSMINSDSKLWDGVVAMRGVPDLLRPKFWAWLCGAGGSQVPYWRRDCANGDAEVTVGGMMVDSGGYDALLFSALQPQSPQREWAAEIEQDVIRTYVEGLRFGECRQKHSRKRITPSLSSRLRRKSFAPGVAREDGLPAAGAGHDERSSPSERGDLVVDDDDGPSASSEGVVGPEADAPRRQLGDHPSSASARVGGNRRGPSKLEFGTGGVRLTSAVHADSSEPSREVHGSHQGHDVDDDDGGDEDDGDLPAVDADCDVDGDGGDDDERWEVVEPDSLRYTADDLKELVELSLAAATMPSDDEEYASRSPSLAPAAGHGSHGDHLPPLPSFSTTTLAEGTDGGQDQGGSPAGEHPCSASPSREGADTPPDSRLRTPSADEISSDVAFRRERLRGLLSVIAANEPSIRYTQGMNFVAAFLLETCSEPHVGYNMFRRLLRQYDFTALFTSGLANLRLKFYQFERLLCRHLPRLHAHLALEEVSPAMYAAVWFLTVFSSFSAFDLATTRVLWDRFFCAGWKEVFRFALALMKVLQPVLLDKPFEALLPVLQSPRLYYEDTGFSIVAIANTFDVSRRQLREMEADYNARRTDRVTDSPSASRGDEADTKGSSSGTTGRKNSKTARRY